MHTFDLKTKECQTDLVGTERVGQHVAATRPQHVNLLAHVVLELLKLALGPSDLSLNLKKERIGQLGQDTFHMTMTDSNS